MTNVEVRVVNRVWIVEQGCYSDRGIIGVYESREAAIAHHPVTDELRRRYPDASWKERTRGWSNGCDWDDLINITPFEVEGMPNGAADPAKGTP